MMTELKFYPKSHTYKYGRKKLVSVTQFISQFFDKFDAKEVARKLAKFKKNKEEKKGVRYWLNEWKESSEHGTRVHKAIEEAILNPEYRFECIQTACKEIKDLKKTEQGIAWFDAWLGTKFTRGKQKRLDLSPEYLVYDTDIGLAGTIDLMINDNGHLWLIDWKTNKSIDKTGYKNKKAQEPLQELDDCNYNKYALQLAFYSYLLEEQGYNVQECLLVHLREDSVMPYSINPHDYYRHIEEMIKWQKQKKQKHTD